MRPFLLEQDDDYPNGLPLEQDPPPLDWHTLEEAPPVEPAAPEMQPTLRPMQSSPRDPMPAVSEVQPSERGTGGSKQQVDPELAFMAAFSGNPTLQRMLEQQQMAPQRQAAEDRAQEKWELERDTMAPLRAQKTRTETALAGTKLEAADPNSEYSKAMREGVAQRLGAEAARVKAADPDLANMLSSASNGLMNNPRLSGSAAIDIAKHFKGIGDRVVSDAHKAAQLAETQRVNDARMGHWAAQDKNAQARIDAARQRALEPKTGARERAAQIKNQEKLDDEVEKADWARNVLLSIADIKQQVNTGPIAGRVQSAAQLFDLAPESFNRLKQRLAMVSNRIIKELSGSAVTGNEWSRMQDELANIFNDDKNFETKLAEMIDLTESIKQRAINRYARQSDGAPADTTNTAARMTGGRPAVRAGERPPPDATPGRGAAPAKPSGSTIAIGQTATNPKTGEQVKWDGAKWNPVKK